MSTIDNKEKELDKKFLMRFARECLKYKNYYQADLALQVCQQRYSSYAGAYNLQAILAIELGLPNQALSFVNQALKLQPSFIRAIENKKIINDRLLKQRQFETENHNNGSRYLLIHSWGSGLGFDLLYLLKQLMIAELTSREAIVYWGGNSLYNSSLDSSCFTDYFQEISETAIEDLQPIHQGCYPKFWRARDLTDYVRSTHWHNKINNHQYKITGIYFLNRKESLLVSGEYTTIKTLVSWVPKGHRLFGLSVDEIYSDLMKKYIRPKEYLQERARNFLKKSMKGKEFIAIHLRGTDKKQEKQSKDIADINGSLIEELTKLDTLLPIFVMTDDSRQIDSMKKRFGERVHSIEVTRSDGDNQGVHHVAKDKNKIGQEVIVDMLIAAQSTYFFGCGFSYLACCVYAMRGKSKESILRPYNLLNYYVDVPEKGRFGIE